MTLDKRHSGIFDNMNYTYMKGIGGFEQILKGLKNMNDPLLKKHYSEALEMLKEENKMQAKTPNPPKLKAKIPKTIKMRK